GQPVDGFQGALPEGKVKEFLDKHLPPADELPPEEEQAAAEPEDSSPAAVLEKLKAALENDPANDNARFDYVRLLLQHGQLDHAKAAFAPAVPKVAPVRKFEALQHWLDAIESGAAYPDISGALAGFDAKIAANKRDFEARYALAQLHMSQQRWVPAMDELLEILMRDKSWNEELGRKTFVSILEIIEPPKAKVADGQIPPDDPVVATYRRRLSSVVLS
ncbi:MAG: tetratricopeptide repeat protein, partial [Polaromonas sp.]|nr:tetratricopeptide repeat protein [Polaromonas sp.]